MTPPIVPPTIVPPVDDSSLVGSLVTEFDAVSVFVVTGHEFLPSSAIIYYYYYDNRF